MIWQIKISRQSKNRPKSVYAYEFTKVHGPTDYLDEAFFTNKSKHKEIIDKANQQKTQRLPHEAYLKHFMNELHQDILLWAYVNLFTISDISFLYSISEQPIKDALMLLVESVRIS